MPVNPRRRPRARRFDLSPDHQHLPPDPWPRSTSGPTAASRHPIATARPVIPPRGHPWSPRPRRTASLPVLDQRGRSVDHRPSRRFVPRSGEHPRGREPGPGGRCRRLGIRRPVDPRRRAGRHPRRVTASARPTSPRRFAGDPRGRDGFRVSDFDFDEVRDPRCWLLVRRRQWRSPFGPRLRDASIGSDPADVAHFRSGSVLIPTLEEALIFTREHGWLANVEIKSFPDAAAGPGRARPRSHRSERDGGSRLASSFDHDDVVAARSRSAGTALASCWPRRSIASPTMRSMCRSPIRSMSRPRSSEPSRVAYRRRPRCRPSFDAILSRPSKRETFPSLVYTVNPGWGSGASPGRDRDRGVVHG